MRFELLDDEPEQQISEDVEPSEKAQQIAKHMKVFGYQPKPETIEAIRKPLVQKLRMPGTEFATSLLGAPGDVMAFVNQLIAKPITEKITGREGVPFEETPLGAIIPTSERLHRGFEEIAGEKIRPETTGEEILGTTAGFLGSMLGLGAKGIGKPGRLPFTTKQMPAAVKTVLSAFAPASAYVGAKKADLPPWAVASAAIGTSLLTHKLTNKTIGQMKNDLYAMSDTLSKDVMLPSKNLVSRLDNLQGIMSKGLRTGPKSRINTLIEEMKGKAGGGAILLEDLIQFRKDIIEVGKEFTKDQLKGSETFWKGLRQSVDNSIQDYEKTNPKFSQAFRQANSLHRGLMESKRMETFLNKHRTLSGLAGIGGGLSALLKSVLGVGQVSGLAAIKAYNFTRAMTRNPGLRKAWKDVFKNAVNENVRGTARSLKNFNMESEKAGIGEEKEKRFELID